VHFRVYANAGFGPSLHGKSSDQTGTVTFGVIGSWMDAFYVYQLLLSLVDREFRDVNDVAQPVRIGKPGL